MAGTASYTLLHSKACGSAIVQACLELGHLPHTVEELPYGEPGPGRDRLLALNPLGQVPVLILPDGTVMTESAAMVLHLAEQAPDAGLAPAAGDPTRPAFLRWLAFLVAAIYPNFTYGDDTSRYVSGKEAQKELRATTDAYAQRCWRMVESGVVADPWFLGRELTALDLYLAVTTRWRPRRPWFAEHCPKVHAVALRADGEPRLAEVWERNFG
jgi:GST-like protein